MPATIPAPIVLAPRVVVLDDGEVIFRSPSEADRAALVARAGADGERFWPVHRAHREGLDRGSTSIAESWLREPAA
jgi:putative hydrolase of the HAD superfamily